MCHTRSLRTTRADSKSHPRGSQSQFTRTEREPPSQEDGSQVYWILERMDCRPCSLTSYPFSLYFLAINFSEALEGARSRS